MSKTIAALFESPQQADYAIDGLEQAGFTPYQISMLVNESAYKSQENKQENQVAAAVDQMSVNEIRLARRMPPKSPLPGNIFLAVHAFTPAQEITAWNLMNDANAQRVITFAS